MEGPHGLPGIKGEQGEPGTNGEPGKPGTVGYIEERIRKLEDSVLKNKELMKMMTNAEICYMGVKYHHIIPDSQIAASSEYSTRHQAHNGRLDNIDSSSTTYPIWSAARNVKGEWHQVDFGEPKPIGGIVTQGRVYHDQWVSSFKISHGNSTGAMVVIRENGLDKVFTGNSDRSTKVTNMFPHVITSRYIRVHPQTWQRHVSMRVEYIDGKCHGLL
ncbi:lactadherin-like isoform X2 [Styela clava]